MCTYPQEALAQPQGMHPEVKKLRQLQQIEASSVLVQLGVKEEALAQVSQEVLVKTKVRGRAKMRSLAKTLLPHCKICGAISHKEPTCPYENMVGDGIPERTHRAREFEKNKKLAKVVSRLQYTQVALRTQSYEQRPSKRSRAPLERSFKALLRARPSELDAILLEDGILRDLKGCPCPRERCAVKAGEEDWRKSTKVLGKRCKRDYVGPDLLRGTVFHRCVTCGVAQGPMLYQPLFAGFSGKRNLGVTNAVAAFWNCCEEVPIAVTVRQLEVGEDMVQRYYDRCKSVLAFDALHLQSCIEWGTGSSLTCDVEMDCTVVAKWREAGGASGRGQITVEACIDAPGTSTMESSSDTVRYCYYTWMGARKRGDESALFLMPAGITYTEGNGRVAQESEELYHRFCGLAFHGKSHGLVSMTDGASCYWCQCEQCKRTFVEHHWVNHSRRPHPELSRPVTVIKDTKSFATRDGKAGTQTIDHEWGLLKEKLPRGRSARVPLALARLDRDMRAAQWCRMCSTYDRWPRFLAAVRRWTDAQEKPAVDKPGCDAPADALQASSDKTGDALELGADTLAEADDEPSAGDGRRQAVPAAGGALAQPEPKEQAHSSQTAGCSSCGCFSHASNESPLCAFHGRDRGALPWVTTTEDRKDTAMHIQDLGGNIRHRSQLAWRPLPAMAGCKRVEVEGEVYTLGSASDSANNCFIDTLRQCMGINADIALVRKDMRQEFDVPCGPTCNRLGNTCAQDCSRVWQDNFLCLDLHWRAVIRLLGKHCSSGPDLSDDSRFSVSLLGFDSHFSIRCIDLQQHGHGDVLGDKSANRALTLARVNGNHFIPCLPK